MPGIECEGLTCRRRGPQWMQEPQNRWRWDTLDSGSYWWAGGSHPLKAMDTLRLVRARKARQVQRMIQPGLQSICAKVTKRIQASRLATGSSQRHFLTLRPGCCPDQLLTYMTERNIHCVNESWISSSRRSSRHFSGADKRHTVSTSVTGSMIIPSRGEIKHTRIAAMTVLMGPMNPFKPCAPSFWCTSRFCKFRVPSSNL